jgi:hypothetical protein
MNNNLNVVGNGEGNVEKTKFGSQKRDQIEQGFGVWPIGVIIKEHKISLDK